MHKKSSNFGRILFWINDIKVSRVEEFLLLIKANRIESLAMDFSEYDVHFPQLSKKLTREECERLDKAFEENISLLGVKIPYRFLSWPHEFPCLSFHELKDEAERLSSVPEIDKGYLCSESFTFAPRNSALKEASEILAEKRDPIIRSVLSEYFPNVIIRIIDSYDAKAMGKELENIVSEVCAERWFPKQLPILRQFGIYKKAKTTQDSMMTTAATSKTTVTPK
jgi:hypothetical protein